MRIPKEIHSVPRALLEYDADALLMLGRPEEVLAALNALFAETEQPEAAAFAYRGAA